MADSASWRKRRRFARAVGRLPPVVVGAAWLGFWGLVTSGAMFLRPALVWGWSTVVLYVVTPGLAAGLGGAIVIWALLAEEKPGIGRGVCMGVLAVVLAHLLFAPLFAAGSWAFDWWFGRPGHVEPLGLTVATLIVGFLTAGPVTLGVGAVTGGLLAYLWNRVPTPPVQR